MWVSMSLNVEQNSLSNLLEWKGWEVSNFFQFRVVDGCLIKIVIATTWKSKEI
jgi:hypothetical protein